MTYIVKLANAGNIRFSSVSGKSHKERNDCTVIALAHCFDLCYDEAHLMLQKQGNRRKGSGINFSAFLTAYPHAMERVNLHTLGLTLSEAIVAHCEETGGDYIALVAGHTFAIRDGIIFDHSFKFSNSILGLFKRISSFNSMDAALFA